MPKDLQSVLLKNGIDGCVAVQAEQSENETEFLLGLAEEHTFIKGIVGWVDLKNPLVEERLVFYSQKPHFKGVRHIVQAEPDDFMLDKDFQRGISYLQPLGLTYDILVYPKQLPAAIQLVENFPEQSFVIDHIAKPEIRDRKMEPWKKQIKEISLAKNVYCKLSGMVTEANWMSWKDSELIPYMDVVFEFFGADRIMFGSDWPVCNLAGYYSQVIKLAEDYCTQFDESTRTGIFGVNAVNFYKLD